VLFGIDRGPGSLISRLVTLESSHRLKVGIGNLDNFKIKISIFIFIFRFSHSTSNARPIRPHKIKRVAHYCRLRVVGGKSALNRRTPTN
jgi:hypothetical protein